MLEYTAWNLLQPDDAAERAACREKNRADCEKKPERFGHNEFAAMHSLQWRVESRQKKPGRKES